MSTKEDFYYKIREIDKLLASDLTSNFITGDSLNQICAWAAGILLITFLLNYLSEVMKGKGHTIQSLKSQSVPVILILVTFCNPLVYKGLAGMYLNVADLFMTYLGKSQIGELREDMMTMFTSFFDTGENGISSFWGFVKVLAAPIPFLVSSYFFSLFLLSVYMIIAIPAIVTILVLSLGPLMAAFYPIDKEMLRKYFGLLWALGILLPAVLNGLMLVIVQNDLMAFLADLMGKQNVYLLSVVAGAYSIMIAYSLALVGYIGDVKLLSDLRALFPITWFELLITKSVGVLNMTGTAAYKAAKKRLGK